MNKYKKLAGNTLIFALGSFGTKLLSFIMIRFYTDCMTTDQFGDADILYQTGNLIYPIITLSMADALIRFGLDKAYDKKKLCTAAVTATLGIGASPHPASVKGSRHLVSAAVYPCCSCSASSPPSSSLRQAL